MRYFLFMLCCAVCLNMASCAAKKGCPSSGRNVGAERLLSGDKKTAKAVRQAGKFRGGKF